MRLISITHRVAAFDMRDAVKPALQYHDVAAIVTGRGQSVLSLLDDECGMDTLLPSAAIDDHAGSGQIASRIGIRHGVSEFDSRTGLFSRIIRQGANCRCIFVEEAWLLTRDQVWWPACVAPQFATARRSRSVAKNNVFLCLRHWDENTDCLGPEASQSGGARCPLRELALELV